jgi:hypothetical protein
MSDGLITAIVADYANRPAPKDAHAALYEAAIAMRKAGALVTVGVPALAAIAKAWGAAVPVNELINMIKAREEVEVAPAPTNALRGLIQAEIEGTYTLIPWPFPMITDRSRSLLPGSVTILCGAPGGAKSWWVISCLRYWIDGVAPAAVLMLEETRAWHLNRVLAQIEGNIDVLDCAWVKAHPEVVVEAYERNRQAIDSVSNALWCEGDRTLRQCAEWVEERCAAGCRVMVIDPITLASPGDEKPWDADRKFMTRVKVAIEAAGASLVLVSHPRKAPGGKGGPPTMDDMAGGVVFSRAAASLIWINGTELGTRATVVDSNGEMRSSQIHKVMRIMKSRNSAGQHDAIGFTFNALTFAEAGVINGQASEPKAGTRPSRGKRMKSEPSKDPAREAIFGEGLIPEDTTDYSLSQVEDEP